MAELLVFARDTIGVGARRNAKLPKRGHVITVQADGWNWGNAELTDPMFRILKFPAIGVAAFGQLLSWEIPTEPRLDQPSDITNTLQYRGFKLNITLASLPAALRNYLTDNTRVASSFTINGGAAAIAAAVEKCAAIPDI